MNFCTRRLRTLLIAVAAAVGAVGLSGCGEDEDGGHTHTWGAWVVTTPATCDAAGVETRTCTTDASHKETREVAKLSGEACESGGGGNFDINAIEMVYVEGGTFTMGCTEEQGDDCGFGENPTHEVTLSGYYIGKYEVTQGLWKAVMGSLPSSLTSSYEKGDNYSVCCVSWNDIVNDFLPELNRKTGKSYRLPTEAEWEYAARGGSNSNGYKYSGGSGIDSVAWYSGNGGARNPEVGTKKPNELCIYDMSGNVWEWVNDWYGSYSSNAQTNPQGPSSGSKRVRRGGGWDIDARFCRVSYRGSDGPDDSHYYVGFRLAVSP